MDEKRQRPDRPRTCPPAERPAWMDKDDEDLTSEDFDAMFEAGTKVEIVGPAEIRIVP